MIDIKGSSFTLPLFRFLTLGGDSTIEVASNKATTPKMDAFNDANPAYIDLNYLSASDRASLDPFDP